MKVIVKDKETLESAIDRFSKKVAKSGILKEVRERRYHTKKSEKRNKLKRKRAYSQRKSK